jgi:hypothetical protein
MIIAASRPGRQGSLPMEAESRRTVVVAMVANIGVAIAKLIAAFFTGSSAMLAETYPRRCCSNSHWIASRLRSFRSCQTEP